MSVQIVAETSSQVVNELAMAPVAFGVVTFSILTAMFLITHAFRSVGTRH